MTREGMAAKFKPLLEQEAGELRAQSETSASSRATVTLDQQSVGRLSRMDAMQAQAMAQATERRRHQRMLQVEAALKRIAEDEYGYCLSCGEEIEERRLVSDAAAPLCIGCSRGES
ncbi:TraR/DksA family transcriptional regulator [Parvibaculum sp.]|uniref:TraR/DksA family transcriptional regulator n=1 Tax=Parvibaculum sp. TaxID=2024848 RepID=UPI003BA8E344